MKQTLCISLSLFIWSCSENNFNDSDLSTSFYENDQKKEEGYMKDEKKQGKWTAWYQNEQKWREGIFKDGAEDGKWSWWNEDGKKKIERTFKVGELITEKEWDKSGNLVKHRVRGKEGNLRQD